MSRWPISRILAVNWPQPRASIEFPCLAVFARPGCKPANQVRTQVRTFRIPLHPALASADGAFGLLTRTAGCEPQTLRTLFSGQTVAQCCARAPVLECRQEGPVLPGRAAASRSGHRQHSSEVNIPNAHPLFRDETPGNREFVDFIWF